MIRSFFNIFGLKKQIRATIHDAKQAHVEIKRTVSELVSTLNGEDRWFLKLCDKNEDDCKPTESEKNRGTI